MSGIWLDTICTHSEIADGIQANGGDMAYDKLHLPMVE